MTIPPHVTRFSSGGATLVIEATGSGTRTFVLIHGIGMGRSVFADLTQHLLPHGRVVAIDLPGYGEAPEPPKTLTIERHADVVAALLADRAYPDVTLIGHSMGAQIAVEVVVRHPGLAHRIVLAAPTVDPTARRAAAQLGRLARDIAVESPVVWARGARAYFRAGPNLRLKLRAMLAHRIEGSLPEVRVPAIVLRGDDDIVAPHEWCEMVARLLPDASLAEIEDHGHETMIRDAAPAAALIARFAADA
jgi:pimeloyl-ACP methyl ester carboxylesterase